MERILKSIFGKKILVIGDIMLDHYIWGDVSRISPEAPVPVVNVIKDSFTAGGAANVALNLSNLGVNVSLLGCVANDDAGKKLAKILKKSNVKLLKISDSKNTPTIIKTRVIIRTQQLCRIDREASKTLYSIPSSTDLKELLKDIEKNYDSIIISDYNKGFVSQELIDHLMKISTSNKDLLLTIDPKPANQLLYKKMGLMTPNRLEALELAGLSGNHIDKKYPIEDICKQIHKKFDPKLLVITLGADGMVISVKGKILNYLPTYAKEVYDVSGAGDTVIAALTAALLSRARPDVAAKFANIAAGCVVSHMGTVPIDYLELMQKLKTHD